MSEMRNVSTYILHICENLEENKDPWKHILELIFYINRVLGVYIDPEHINSVEECDYDHDLVRFTTNSGLLKIERFNDDEYIEIEVKKNEKEFVEMVRTLHSDPESNLYNFMKYLEKNIGIRLDPEKITKVMFGETIIELLTKGTVLTITLGEPPTIEVWPIL
ncbi:MAG: hypothetical protein QXH21_09230 [Ignisphaera sp.]